MAGRTKRAVASGLLPVAAQRVQRRLQRPSHSSRRLRVAARRALVTASVGLIGLVAYHAAVTVLEGQAPAWMLGAVLVLGGACLLLANGMHERTDALSRSEHTLAVERRDAGDRFRSILDAAPVAILLVDRDGSIALANATAARLFRYPDDALVGRPVDTLVPEHLRPTYAAFRTAYATHPDERHLGSDRDLFALARDGTGIPVELSLKPVQLDGAAYVLVAVTDLTERKARDAESIRQRDELAHLSRVKVLGEMCGALAHELNQPIAAIMSNAQAAQRMLRHAPTDTEEVRAALVDIVDSDRRAGEVIRRLRSWLRKDHEAFAPLDANDVVVSSMRLLRMNLIGRGVDVHLDLGHRLPLVFGDRVQLQQVLVNLVMNGCDAMDGLPQPRRLDVRTEASSGRVRIRVEDEGTGIAAAVQGRLFEPFETTKAQGMGMGLAVCRTIVEAHGGTIHADNNRARGATVWFDLPGVAT